MRAATPSPPEPTPCHAQTMTAARVHRFGPPDVITLEQIDVPQPRKEEVPWAPVTPSRPGLHSVPASG